MIYEVKLSVFEIYQSSISFCPIKMMRSDRKLVLIYIIYPVIFWHYAYCLYKNELKDWLFIVYGRKREEDFIKE